MLPFAVQQFYTEQHPSCCDGRFIRNIHFAGRGFDASKGIYFTLSLCSATISFKYAS